MPVLEQLNSDLAGRYVVEREIGAGGMATVYLARDVRHGRKVALKLLRPELGAVLGVERFHAEIQVTANLQHPNLLALFDSGEAAGSLFYVMPYIEGESLRVRLAREKQLPVEEAVRIAVGVASALDYAHGHGVIHRDLKPDNILLHAYESPHSGTRGAWQPLVADFGIALAVSNAAGQRMTGSGVSLGTPEYMSPEQASGEREIDGRSDIYALGAVTYEMLAGETPHSGTRAQAIIARILTETPRSIRAVRPNVPAPVAAAVERALQKLPADRWSTGREFAEALQGGRSGEELAAVLPSSRRPVRSVLPWAAAVLGLGLAAVLYARFAPARDEPAATLRYSLDFTATPPAGPAPGSPLALSPDGKLLAFVGTTASGFRRLFVRPLGELGTREFPGTDNAEQPFFSPDGKWIGFYAAQQLKKVSAEGGIPVTIGRVPAVAGASWGGDERIVVSTQGALAVIPAGGGAVRPFSKPDTAAGETLQRWPRLLADGNTVVYTAWGVGGLERARIGVALLEGGSSQILDLPGTSPFGVLEGRLLYASATGTIMAVAFDERRRRVTGTPTPVVDGAQIGPGGALKASVSPSGSLAYLGGGGAGAVVLAAPRGGSRPLILDTRQYRYPRFSPDGKRLAVTVTSPTGNEIHLFDLSSMTLSRLTAEGQSGERPEWTPDGKRVLFTSTGPGPNSELWWRPADLSAPAELLYRSDRHGVTEGLLSPDGRTLVVRLDGGLGNQDIWYRQLSGDTLTKPLLQNPAVEVAPRVSPDGRWVAYSSDESGSVQTYVTPLPGPGPRHLVSVDGGMTPVWSRDGRRLFYVSGQRLLGATLRLAPAFAVLARDTLFEGGFVPGHPYHANYDLAPDGEHFALVRSVTSDAQVIVVHGWQHELRARFAAPP